MIYSLFNDLLSAWHIRGRFLHCIKKQGGDIGKNMVVITLIGVGLTMFISQRAKAAGTSVKKYLMTLFNGKSDNGLSSFYTRRSLNLLMLLVEKHENILKSVV